MSEVTYNGVWYTVTTPGGDTWTFDPDGDENLEYIDGALWAWSRWRDFVEASQNATGA